MRSRHECLFHRFRRHICPNVAGWLIAAQLLPLARLEARTLPSSMPARAVEWNTTASGATSEAVPADASASPVVSPSPAVNRTVPAVAPPTPFAGFSASPTDEEFLRGRVFAEALVPIGRATTFEENRALAAALNAYQRGTPEVTAPFDTFLRDHADTPWRASLLVNIGGRLRDTGAYTRALAAWDAAWTLTKHATDPHGRAVADLALAEWLTLSFALMRIDEVEARLAAIATRDVRGSSGNRVALVRERLASWRAHPEQFVPAEARALARLSSFIRKDDRTIGAVAASVTDAEQFVVGRAKKARASRPLGWLIGPAKRLGLRLRAMRRGAGAPFAAGALVPLKNGHLLALLESRGDRFTAYDAVLNRELSVSRATLDEEASDYALMSGAAARTAGWTEVAVAALPMQILRCPPGTPDDFEPCPCTGGAGAAGPGGPPASPPGMPTYRLHHAIAGLVIQDTPVTYSVPRGPAPVLSVSYASRDREDPAIFTFSNMGQKWRFDWRAYIQEHPLSCWSYLCEDPEFRVVLRGGGHESYEPPNSSWTTLGPHWRSRAVIVRTSSSPLQYERRLPDGSKEVYGVSEGTFLGARLFLTDVFDPQGQSVHLTYDAQFRLVSLTDAIGQVTTLSYEHASDPLKITKITDPFGRFAAFTYNGAGQLASITDAIGLTSTFEYGADDFILAMTTPYGTSTFRTDNPIISGRFLEATDPLGGTERVEYWPHHLSLPETVSASEVPTGFTAANQQLDRYVTLYWDKRAMMLQPRALASATVTKWLLRQGPDFFNGSPNTSVPYSIKRPLESRVWYQYPNQLFVGHPSVGTGTQPSVTARVLDDGSSQIWQATYNTLGHVTSRTDPVGRRTSYVYAANNIDLLEVRQTTGSMNELLATYSNYTTTHLPQTITDAAGQSTTITYNAAGQVLTTTNAKSETTTSAYDAGGLGYLQSVTGPVPGATTTYTYDAGGRVRTTTDSDGYTLTMDYDPLDRLTKTTYPDGTFEQRTFNRLDVAESRDRLGRITRYQYDALRRPVSTRDPLGRTITQQWCGCGSLEALVDAKGQKTSWQRDIQSRVTQEVRADGVTQTVYAYEATTSRLKTVTDPKLQVTTYTYNLDDSRQSITFTNAVISTPSVAFTYDASYNRQATMVDGTGTTSYTYHPVGVLGAGQVASVDGPLTNDTLSYAYDELTRVTTRAVNAVGLTYSYDALGRVSSEVNALGTFAYGYHGATNRLASVLYPNGQTSTYAYLGNTMDHRLQTIHHKRADTSTLSRHDYTYDATGNILTWQQQADSTPAELWRYAYDASDQLVTAVKWSTGGSPTVLRRYAYTYDPAGNRTTEQIDDVATLSTHDALNRLTQQQPGGALRFAGSVNEPATVTIQGRPAVVDPANNFGGAVTTVGGTNAVTIQAVDPAGNVTNMQYNVAVVGTGRTFSSDANGNLTADDSRTFEWDARNQLVAVTYGTHRSEFTYDGLQRRVRMVEKENGVVQSDTKVVWCETNICEERTADGTTAIRRAFQLGEQIGGAARFFAPDHLRNIGEVTDGSNTLLARYVYDSWGRRVATFGTDVTTVGHTGHRSHTASSLSLARYRAYDATLARWLSRDPLGMVNGPNVHAYVGNNPLIRIDPDGRDYLPTGMLNCDPWSYAAFGERGPGRPGEVLILPPGGLPGLPQCTAVPPWWDVDFICTQDGWKKVQGPTVTAFGKALAPRVTDPPPDWVPPFPCEPRRC